MSDNSENPAPVAQFAGGRIEGGVDAVVVGATADGLIAATLLAKAGVKTVLLEAGVAPPQRREFAPGYFADDGDFLVRNLDPGVIADLDLYRHGLSFAQRRFDSVYYFEDDGVMKLDGDLLRKQEALEDDNEDDADALRSFSEEVLEASHEIRAYFLGEPIKKMSARTRLLLETAATMSLDQFLETRFEGARLKAVLAAEASLRSGLKPSDPYSFLTLLRRWSGEAAGLQGAFAFPTGGYCGLYDALRRAAQNAGVEMRAGGVVRSVLVEWDKAAGVALGDGGQIRAPTVVQALDGETAFTRHVGPDLIDIEFQKAITPSRPRYASAKFHLALKGTPRDGATKLNLSRRLIYALDKNPLRRAYRDARTGEVAPELLMELVFPSAFDEGWAPPNGQLGVGFIHPIPFYETDEVDFRTRLRATILRTFDRVAPGAEDRVEGVDIVTPADMATAFGLPARCFAGAGAAPDEARRASASINASGIEGLFFCGPEAQVGRSLSGAAGRRAGKNAAKYARRKRAA